ncbi:MAG: Uma2 family endonuclease [Pyrinomonadaceae bacterium]|jgi:Uma2 family endonuclease|nr:Uma2 family endonuclease [Pyrinomonadaceae bacterium]
MLAVKEKTPQTQFKVSRKKSDYYAIVKKLPEKADIIFGNTTWNDYETLIKEVGEASHLRISYTQGNLKVMTLSSLHENYSALIQTLLTHLSFRKKIKVLCYKSATMKVTKELKGVEPDGCFYVQSADKLPNKLRIDFSQDPMPDIILEIDIYHDSISKFEIYATFGVKEIWRYDGKNFQILELQKNAEYKEIKRSKSLPILTAKVLNDFLNKSNEKDQYEILLDFEEWLKTQE